MCGDLPAANIGTTITAVSRRISPSGSRYGVRPDGTDGTDNNISGATRSRTMRRTAMTASTPASRCIRVDLVFALWAPTSVVDMEATPLADKAPRDGRSPSATVVPLTRSDGWAGRSIWSTASPLRSVFGFAMVAPVPLSKEPSGVPVDPLPVVRSTLDDGLRRSPRGLHYSDNWWLPRATLKGEAAQVNYCHAW